MSTWLFDLGNTRLKCAPLLADGGVGETTALAHADDVAWLQALPRGDVACVASVVAGARQQALMQALASRYGRVHRVRTEPALGPLRIAYAEPAHLGVDRFLSMLEVAHGPAASLVVGVGTGLTIDLLDAAGLHRGGRIAPSPELMRRALHAQAPQLPVQGGTYGEFADDTAHALASGCEGAALALIERSLAQAEQLLGTMPQLSLHGGGAAALRARLPVHQWMPDLVLRGLARWVALRIA